MNSYEQPLILLHRRKVDPLYSFNFKPVYCSIKLFKEWRKLKDNEFVCSLSNDTFIAFLKGMFVDMGNSI